MDVQRCPVGVRQTKIAVHDLEIGMFVSDLDRPWHQTPFPIQGFHIRSQDDIRSLVSYCKWVAIDVAETRDSIEQNKSGGRLAAGKSRPSGNNREEVQLPPLSIKEPVSYHNVTTMKKELKASRKVILDAEASLHQVFQAVQEGDAPDLREVAVVTRRMVSSAVRNPDALLWLSRTRHHDDYTYRHSLNTAVWALVCGRQLGLNEGLLNHLGLGCLLSQIGKLDLPDQILRNEGKLNADDFAIYRSYVEKGVAKLADTGLSRAVVSVVQGHRERHNGSGFPEGVRGDRIPLLAKVAGLAEYFETLIGPRDSGEPMTPARAVNLLYDMRNIEFQVDLVEQFIQAIGIYPTGSLVELTDGQRGIVVSHTPERRLWPKVMVMTDREHNPLKSARIVDLARYNDGRNQHEALTIAECLPHGTEGLDPERYDVTGAESRWSLSRIVGA
ncbi:HD domain-containing phosphohydrolase [Marinobacter sp. ATCH36]|uniref:HD-GYP domain-containing protein n=1 Tax=Marinobacter sp. ATCH36 TaxID=2945106 RepID=UPI0032E4E898